MYVEYKWYISSMAFNFVHRQFMATEEVCNKPRTGQNRLVVYFTQTRSHTETSHTTNMYDD